MIGKLSGLVDETGDGWVLVDVGGVGYMVFASARTLAALPGRGEPVTLYIETHVREDHIHLFGFPSRDEMAAFHLLQSVQGVGAKVALGLLSVLSPSEMAVAIVSGDKAAIAKGPGVGPKLAARLINELKDKTADLGSSNVIPVNGAAAAGGSVAGSAFGDAVSALVNLGYRPMDAHGAVSAAQSELGEAAKLEELIRRGLKELSA